MSHLDPYFGIEFPEAAGRAVLVCEHASNEFLPLWDMHGLTSEQVQAHLAWDTGALGLARAQDLDGVPVHAHASRLICDLNRPPHSSGAIPARIETRDIALNRDIARSEALYIPFHAALAAILAWRLARRRPPDLMTVHSFIPIRFGQRREAGQGLVHDTDDRLVRAVAARMTGLETRINEPYSLADGVAHLLAMHATPCGLPHVMPEVRKDLIAAAAAQQALAARLAPVLRAAMDEVH